RQRTFFPTPEVRENPVRRRGIDRASFGRRIRACDRIPGERWRKSFRPPETRCNENGAPPWPPAAKGQSGAPREDSFPWDLAKNAAQQKIDRRPNVCPDPPFRLPSPRRALP